MMFMPFESPTALTMDVYARVPPELTDDPPPSVWASLHRGLDGMGSFLEGPVLDGQGGFYTVDVARGRILHFHGRNSVSVVIQYQGEPNGLALVAQDRLLITDYRNGLLQLQLGTTPQITTVVDRFGPEGFKGLNDLALMADGRVFFTDQGATGLHDPSGRVFCLHPDGRLDAVVDGIPSPNGVLVDERSNTLYIAVTRDNSVWRAPLSPSGAHKVGRFLQFSGGMGPDGLAWGPHGSIAVAHLGLGMVSVFDRLGRPAFVLHSPTGRATTNLIFDSDFRVYVTESESGTLLTADLGPQADRLLVED